MCYLCNVNRLLLTIFCTFLCGFVITLVGIGIRIDDWLIIVFVGISILILSVIWGSCVCCNASKCCYSEEDPRLCRFYMTNFGTTVFNGRRNRPDVKRLQKMDDRKLQDRHDKLVQLLQEEIEQQGEEDIPTVCDKLKDKWQLPQEEYSLFEVALLAHLVNGEKRFNSVKEAAKYLLRQETRDWQISTEFRRTLLEIRSNKEPDDYTAVANIYLLLKSQSDDIGHQDFSPRSTVCEGKPTVSPNVKMNSPSAPFDEINGATPTAPLVQSSDIVIDVLPPNYDEIDK